MAWSPMSLRSNLKFRGRQRAFVIAARVGSGRDSGDREKPRGLERVDLHDFAGYCDESYVSAERFRAIACVSLPSKHEPLLTARFSEVLVGSGLREFKWSRCVQARERLGAIKLIDAAFAAVDSSQLRIDVLLWDTHDARHAVPGRDDNANFERMFYHLLRNVLLKRHPGSGWRLFCDEKLGVDWLTLRDCLRAVGNRRPTEAALFAEFVARSQYVVRQLDQVHSADTPLVQLADLFGGLCVFSRLKYDAFSSWKDSCAGQGSWLVVEPPSLSKSDKERFPVLAHLDERAKVAKLGVSLRSQRGLRTMDPHRPVNFWWYEPQHEKDRAPTRKRE